MQNQTFSIACFEVEGDKSPALISEIIHLISDYPITIEGIIYRESSMGFYYQLTLQGSEHSISDIRLKFKDHSDLKGFSFTYLQEQRPQNQNYTQDENIQHYGFTLTLLTNSLLPNALIELFLLLDQHQLMVLGINTLTETPAGPNLKERGVCLDFSLSTANTDIDRARKELLSFSSKVKADLILQSKSRFRGRPKLIAFDMDSTLIQAEVIDELAKVAGIGEEVAAITHSAMKGEIDFDTSFKSRLALLKGMPTDQLSSIAHSLTLSPGTERLMHYLPKLGIKTAIISGGFEYFGQYLQEMLGFDYVITNKLDIEEGHVTGKVVGKIINREQKARSLENLAAQESISLQETIAVGDGANDLSMLAVSGRGIAYHAKPIVQSSADHSMAHFGLDGILYVLGYSDQALNKLSPSPKTTH